MTTMPLVLAFGLATFLVIRSGVPWWSAGLAFLFGFYVGRSDLWPVVSGFVSWVLGGMEM
ncbi:hypothetical protein [Streptomyces mayteni]